MSCTRCGYYKMNCSLQTSGKSSSWHVLLKIPSTALSLYELLYFFCWLSFYGKVSFKYKLTVASIRIWFEATTTSTHFGNAIPENLERRLCAERWKKRLTDCSQHGLIVSPVAQACFTYVGIPTNPPTTQPPNHPPPNPSTHSRIQSKQISCDSPGRLWERHQKETLNQRLANNFVARVTRGKALK